MAEERWGSWSSPYARQNHGKEFVPWPLQLQREFGQMHFENRICLFYFSQGLGSVRNVQFLGYAKVLGYLLSDLGEKNWPLSDWRESGSPKQGMISHMRNCAVYEAVSDLIGKASIHPEKVSTRISMSFIFHVGGM